MSRATGLVLAVLVVLTIAACMPASGPGAAQRTPATIARVVDGDTVDVNIDGRTERVRLIGIDTPETVDPRKPVQCFGREASERAKQMLPIGADVELEADPSQGERDNTSSHRLLRYLWLPDGRSSGLEMIREGYAHEYTFRTPYKYQAEFKAAEREARDQQRGLWAPATCNGDTQQPAAKPTLAPTTTPRPAATTRPIPTPTRPPAPTATTPPPTTATTPPAPTAEPFHVLVESLQGAGPNRQAHVAVRLDPPRAGVQCSIRYITPAGTVSDAAGLGTKASDRNGRVSWTWLIGGRTGAGTGQFVSAAVTPTR